MPDKCGNCHAIIGDLEEAFVWKDHPICKSCYDKLNKNGKVSLSSKAKAFVLLAAVLLIAIGVFAYINLNHGANTITSSGSTPTVNPPNLQTSDNSTPPTDSVATPPVATPAPTKAPAPKTPLETAKGIYDKTVAEADNTFTSTISVAKADLSTAYDRAISTAMQKGDSQSLDLANRLNDEKKRLLVKDAPMPNTPSFNPNPAEILQLLKDRTWYWHWEQQNKDNPNNFVIAPTGRITSTQQPDVEWNIVQRWVFVSNGHLLVPVDENTINGFFIETGRQVGLFTEQPVTSEEDMPSGGTDAKSAPPQDMLLALKKYNEAVTGAENTHDATLQAARKQLGAAYDAAIALAMRNGSDGLELANQLTKEKLKVVDAYSQPDKSLPFNPTRDEILHLLPGRTWYWHWEQKNKNSPNHILVEPDGRIMTANQANSEWTLVRRWILTHDGHVLIPVDQKTLRGFHISSGRQVGMFTEQDMNAN